jgi:hypothetical protein
MNARLSTISRRALRAGRSTFAPAALILAASLLGIACTGAADSASSVGDEDACARADLELEDGRCQPPGLPLDMPCAPGEAPLEDGSCLAAGVPPAQCGDGFAADGDGGCKALLPANACPDGLVALPGDIGCHPISSCGEGTWGNIPVKPDSQFVDKSYSGTLSDGTQERPWRTIQEGIDAASAGAVVAIAAGTYEEQLVVRKGPRRLRGRCPELVTVAGLAGSEVSIRMSGDGSEIRDLAITGSGRGIVAHGAGELRLDRVWIHDTGSSGLVVETGAVARVGGSLFERTRSDAAQAQHGATLIIEGSVMRDSLPDAEGQRGRAVAGLAGGPVRASVTVLSSVIERASEAGIFLDESDALLDGVVVRDMTPAEGAPASSGAGLSARLSGVTILGSTFERASSKAIDLAGSEALLEHVTIENTLRHPAGGAPGIGLFVLPDAASNTPSAVTLRQSTVAGSASGGVFIDGSSAALESVRVRHNAFDPEAAPLPAVALFGTTAAIRYSVIADNQLLGLASTGGDTTFEASVIRDMHVERGNGGCAAAFPTPLGFGGTLALRSSLLEGCAATGALTRGAELVMETSVIRDVKPNVLGSGGDAVRLEAFQGGALRISGTLLASPAGAGISAAAGDVAIELSAITCAANDLVIAQGGTFDTSIGDLDSVACGCPAAAGQCKIATP